MEDSDGRRERKGGIQNIGLAEQRMDKQCNSIPRESRLKSDIGQS